MQQDRLFDGRQNTVNKRLAAKFFQAKGLRPDGEFSGAFGGWLSSFVFLFLILRDWG
jgi:hypothetical protein